MVLYKENRAMKESTLCKKPLCIITLVLLLLVCATVVYQYNVDKRPGIEVWEINKSPFLFCADQPDLLCPATSIIAKKSIGKKDDENKFHKTYKYVYVIRKHNRWFGRVEYLKFHPADAVDAEVIFSDRLPDPQLFDIIAQYNHSWVTPRR
jgi:hypothetical protein